MADQHADVEGEAMKHCGVVSFRKVIKQTSNMQLMEQKVSGKLFTFRFKLRNEVLPWCWSCEAWHKGKPAVGVWSCHGATKHEAERGCIKAIKRSLRAVNMTVPGDF